MALGDEECGRVERYIDLLADDGVHLGEPFTPQLRGKPRELPVPPGPQADPHHLSHRKRMPNRVTRGVHQHRQRDPHEIDRAWRAMQRCIAEGHVAKESHERTHQLGGHQGGLRDSPARRRGYEKAGRAIRPAVEIRALREEKGLSETGTVLVCAAASFEG